MNKSVKHIRASVFVCFFFFLFMIRCVWQKTSIDYVEILIAVNSHIFRKGKIVNIKSNVHEGKFEWNETKMCFCPCISLKSFGNVGRKRNRLIMKHLHEKETEVNVKYFVSEKSAIDNGNSSSSSTSWAMPTCRYARAIKQETHHYFLVIF